MRRFTSRLAAPAGDAVVPATSSASFAPAGSSLSASDTPAPSGHTAGRPAPVRLSDFGDVLTDADLAALMQRPPSWPRRERDRARLEGRAPYLPARIDDAHRQPRYRRIDVESWMKTGSSTRSAMRRIS
jgi:hypothetical protein